MIYEGSVAAGVLCGFGVILKAEWGFCLRRFAEGYGCECSGQKILYGVSSSTSSVVV